MHAWVQAEELGEAEGTGRSDQLGGGGEADMGIAGLQLPAGSGIIDGLGGMSAAQPFTSADSLGALPPVDPAQICCKLLIVYDPLLVKPEVGLVPMRPQTLVRKLQKWSSA
jgi:hypothetical protein